MKKKQKKKEIVKDQHSLWLDLLIAEKNYDAKGESTTNVPIDEEPTDNTDENGGTTLAVTSNSPSEIAGSATSGTTKLRRIPAKVK